MLEHKVKYDMICSILKSTRSHQAHFSQGAGGETTGGGGGKSSSSPAMSCPTARHPSQRSMTVSGEITTGYKAERASSPQITLEKSPHQVPKSLSAQRSSPPPRSRRVTRQARSKIWFCETLLCAATLTSKVICQRSTSSVKGFRPCASSPLRANKVSVILVFTTTMSGKHCAHTQHAVEYTTIL